MVINHLYTNWDDPPRRYPWDGGPLNNQTPYAPYITWVFLGYTFKGLLGVVKQLGAPTIFPMKPGEQREQNPWLTFLIQAGDHGDGM